MSTTTDNSAAAPSAAALNINAKPFTPNFGGGGAAPAAPANNSNNKGNHNNNNSYNKPQLPPPPMAPPMMMPPFGGMGMPGMGLGMPYNPMMFPGGGMPPHMMNQMMMGQQQQQSRPGYFVPPPQQQMMMNPMFSAAKNNTVTVGSSPSSLGNARAPSSNTPTNGSFAGGMGTPSASSAAHGGIIAAKKPVNFPRKVAFLVLGGRGSGKTTQCEKLAKQFNLLHIAGGQFVAEKKLPLIELARVLGEHFEEGAELGKAKAKKSNNPQSPNDDNEKKSEAAAASEADKSNAPTPCASNSPSNAAAAAPASTAAPAATSASAVHEYNGVILDRMVGLHEYDAYYLDAILRRFGFAVELVFLLMLDSETAGQRATARGDGKPVDHTRQMAEHRVQYAAVNSVYSPLKILHCVECDGMPVEAITRALDRVIETHYASPTAGDVVPPTPLVPHHPYTQGKCKLLTDYARFYQLRQDMLVAVHDNAKPPVICPASLMSGIADRRMFVSVRQARPLVNSFATLKADGQRVLLFKHKEHGIFGINGIFHFMYSFDPYFENFGITLPPAPADWTVPEHGIEWVIDAECFSVEGKTQIAVFDYLYFFGLRGNTQVFEKRLADLTAYFGNVTFAKDNNIGTKSLYGPAPYFLKQFVPSTDLRVLLPDPKNPPFPIDGLVFQHYGGYKFGRDNAIYKWKPREKCTVDFRLDKAIDPQVPGGEWSFVPMVGEDKEEVPWPNAQVRATDADARRCDLCDGTIAECLKREGTGTAQNPFAIWDFVRIRPEKPTPNRMDIAKEVNKMEHMTFEELAKVLNELGGSKK